MKNIHDKMAARGADALDDAELLTLLTEDGQTARALLEAYDGSPARIAGESEARLRMVGGLGLKRARMLLAAAEFGRRVAADQAAEADFVTTSDDVVRLSGRCWNGSRMRSAGWFTSRRRTASSNASA